MKYLLDLNDIKDIVKNFKEGYGAKSAVYPTLDSTEDEIKLEGYLKSKYNEKTIRWTICKK